MENEIKELKERMDKMELIIRESVDMAKSYLIQVTQRSDLTHILWRLDKFIGIFEEPELMHRMDLFRKSIK
jgi:hypothetical protein